MVDKQTFCSSPWLHLRIDYSGTYIPCRWFVNRTDYLTSSTRHNISEIGLLEYFNSDEMCNVRTKLLSGEPISNCQGCLYEESFGKVGGRKKQLFRSKLDNLDTFNESFTSSPHYPYFEFSQHNNGRTTSHPIDLQIDLSTTCNSSCIMCSPTSSSKLVSEYQSLNKLSPVLFNNPQRTKSWADNPVLVEKFVSDLKEMPELEYIHLLGGETLYVESFYTICNALIDAGLSKNIIMGTTTNGTIWSDRLAKIIPEFKEFHLGISLESVSPLNDYIRYPSSVTSVLGIFSKFVELRSASTTLHLTARITPSILSIMQLDGLLQYLYDQNVTAESCKLLRDPPSLRLELLPKDLLATAIDRLKAVAARNGLVRQPKILDIRNHSLSQQVMSNTIFDYVDVLSTMSDVADAEQQRHDLAEFLMSFETIHKNCILDYAPELSAFLIQYGYKRA